MRPEDFVTAQLDLYGGLDYPPHIMRRNTYVGTVMSLQAATMRERDTNPDPLFQEDDGSGEQAHRDTLTDWLLENMTKGARDAHLYRVQADLAALIEHAAERLDGAEVADPTLLPSDDGLVRFERPIHVRTVDGLHYKIHWLLWRTVLGRHDHGEADLEKGMRAERDASGMGEDVTMTSMYFFTDLLTETDEVFDQMAKNIIAYAATQNDLELNSEKKLRENFGRFRPVGAELFITGKPVGKEWVSPQSKVMAVRGPAPDPTAGAAFGMGAGEGKHLTVDAETLMPRDIDDAEAHAMLASNEAVSISLPLQNMARIAYAMFSMMDQPSVATTTPEHVRKHHRQLAERATGKTPRVSSVALRRNAEANKRRGESTVEWTKRWVVRGHWRWQAYGPGRTERRRRWIAPFLKGPDQAPLVLTKKVYTLKGDKP